MTLPPAGGLSRKNEKEITNAVFIYFFTQNPGQIPVDSPP
jgi:hypothetical protein